VLWPPSLVLLTQPAWVVVVIAVVMIAVTVVLIAAWHRRAPAQSRQRDLPPA
jgi:hypothetical protein